MRLSPLVLLLILNLVASCAFAQEPIKKSFKIGWVGPVTGPEKTQGDLQINSALLAINEFKKKNPAFALNIELKKFDNESTPQGTLKAYQAALIEPNMLGILLPIKTVQMVAVAPSIQKAAIPTLSGSSLSRLTGPDNRWFFRMRPKETIATYAMAKYIKETLKLERIALLASDDPYGKNNVNFFEKHAKDFNLNLVYKNFYAADVKDFKPLLRNLTAAKSQIVVGFSTNWDQYSLLLETYKSSGSQIAFFGNSSAVQAALKIYPKDVTTQIYAVADVVSDEWPEAMAYKKLYREAYQSEPDVLMSWTFDALNLLLDTINSKGPDARKIREGLASTKGYRGVFGIYNFSSEGDGLFEATIVHIKQGSPVVAARVRAPRSN